MVMRKVNKEFFVLEYKEFLDYQIKKVFQELFPKIKKCYPHANLYHQEKLWLDKNFLTYQTYVLESKWKHAPFPDFFRGYVGQKVEYKGKVFILQIEDEFLKTKSKVSFMFIAQRER